MTSPRFLRERLDAIDRNPVSGVQLGHQKRFSLVDGSNSFRFETNFGSFARRSESGIYSTAVARGFPVSITINTKTLRYADGPYAMNTKY